MLGLSPKFSTWKRGTGDTVSIYTGTVNFNDNTRKARAFDLYAELVLWLSETLDNAETVGKNGARFKGYWGEFEINPFKLSFDVAELRATPLLDRVRAMTALRNAGQQVNLITEEEGE
jgi:hypothetical protein